MNLPWVAVIWTFGVVAFLMLWLAEREQRAAIDRISQYTISAPASRR
jgi:hypothetical protein